MFQQPTSTSRRVAMNTGILYARMSITMFISLYTTRVILNSLGASDFGIFGIVGSAIAMLGFLEGSMASATMRFMSHAEGEGDKEKQKNIFNVSVILHFLIAVFMCLVLSVAGHFFFNGVLNIPQERMFAARMVYYFMIASTMLTIMTVPYDAILNAHENMLYYAIVGFIESVLKLAVAAVVVYTLSDKLIVYGALMAGVSLLVMIIMRVYCHRNYEECVLKPRVYFNKDLMKKMTGFAGWNFTTNSINVFTNYGQSFVINIFFGPIANAAQGIASMVCGQLGAFSANMLKALNPVIVKSEGGGNRAFMLKASMTGAKLAFYLLMFFFVPVMVEMPYIFKVWLKNPPDYTIVFCRLLFIRFLMEQLISTLGLSIAAVGNIRNYSICQSILYLFVLPVGYLFYSLQFPAYSLHIIFIVTVGISLVMTIIFANRLCDLSISEYLTKVIFRCVIPFAITLGASAIPLLLMESGFYRLLVVLFINTVVFFGTVWFYGFIRDERRNITQMIITFIKKKWKKSLLEN